MSEAASQPPRDHIPTAKELPSDTGTILAHLEYKLNV